MNDSMYILLAIQGIALYEEKGPATAVGYLRNAGMTTFEAFNVIEMWEDAQARVKAGLIP